MMRPYVNYEYYVNVYKGDMPEPKFSRFAMIATQKIKLHTFSRIKENAIPEEVKYCTCVLADKLSKLNKNEGIASEKVSSWSVSYKDSSFCDESIAAIIKEFLFDCKDENGTSLLYRGC